MDSVIRALLKISLYIVLAGCASALPPTAPPELPEWGTAPDAEREQEERRRAEIRRRQQQAQERISGDRKRIQELARQRELERRANENSVKTPPMPSIPTTIPINTMKLFQWPPPKPSSFSVVLRDYLALPTSVPSLAQVENLLRKSLDNAGYYDVSYYGIKDQSDSFVMATRLEKINDNATSVSGEERWVSQLGQKKIFSLSDYLNELFYAKSGKYRIILFIITAEPIDFNKEKVNVAAAKAWVSDGNASLTKQVRQQVFSEQHQVTALIYEFEKFESENKSEKDGSETNNTTILNLPGKHQTRTHLENSGIWSSITKQ